MLPALETAVFRVLPDVPLHHTATLDELMARQSAQHRLTMLMLGSFGVLGAVIAEIGIFGLMAYVVAQRTREVGVRMALGAIRSRVMAMVMSKAFTLVSASVILGSAGAWYLSTTAKTFLFALEAHDPRAFTGVLATLALTALPASAIPARRVRSVDPIYHLVARSHVLRLFADGWSAFLVPNALAKDRPPSQPTEAVGDRANRLGVSKA